MEPWNAISSLMFSLFGLIGILYSDPTKEIRVTMLYTLLIVIGFGSTALHASLHWFAQSLDELPMLWLNVYTLYYLSSLHEPLDPNQNKEAQHSVGDKDIETCKVSDSSFDHVSAQ